MNHLLKMFLLIVLKRLQARVEPFLAEEQAGFRKDRALYNKYLMLRLIAERTLRKQQKFVYNCFIDFRKAFDTVSHDVCWAVLRSYGVEEKIINILSHIYENSKAAVRLGKDI